MTHQISSAVDQGYFARITKTLIACCLLILLAEVTQLVECQIEDLVAAGSIPALRTNHLNKSNMRLGYTHMTNEAEDLRLEVDSDFKEKYLVRKIKGALARAVEERIEVKEIPTDDRAVYSRILLKNGAPKFGIGVHKKYEAIVYVFTEDEMATILSDLKVLQHCLNRESEVGELTILNLSTRLAR